MVRVEVSFRSHGMKVSGKVRKKVRKNVYVYELRQKDRKTK